LFELLGEIGVRRQDCFVTNVVKCRPPDNRTPRREELEACRPWLLEQFRQCDANVVLALGNTSAKAVFGFTDPMGAVHGKVFELGSSRGIATYHPAAALRGGPSVVDVMRADLLILQALLAAS
jgi:DNA polymerase